MHATILNQKIKYVLCTGAARYACVVLFFFKPAYAGFDLLKSSDNSIKQTEINRLGAERIRDAVPELILLLQDNSTETRLNAIVSLGQIADKTSLKSLIEVIKNDSDEAPKLMAVQALGRFRGEDIRPVLFEASDSENGKLRAAAIRVMAKKGGKADIARIIEKAEKDEDPSVQEAAINALSTALDQDGIEEQDMTRVEGVMKKAALNNSDTIKTPAEKTIKKMGKKAKTDVKKEGKKK